MIGEITKYGNSEVPDGTAVVTLAWRTASSVSDLVPASQETQKSIRGMLQCHTLDVMSRTVEYVVLLWHTLLVLLSDQFLISFHVLTERRR